MRVSTGSLQLCPILPDDIKAVYRTVWDLNPIDLIDMAADRAPFIDQSQSLTLGIRRPTPALMVSSFLYFVCFVRMLILWLTFAAERPHVARVACRLENWVILPSYPTSRFHGSG